MINYIAVLVVCALCLFFANRELPMKGVIGIVMMAVALILLALIAWRLQEIVDALPQLIKQ